MSLNFIGPGRLLLYAFQLSFIQHLFFINLCPGFSFKAICAYGTTALDVVARNEVTIRKLDETMDKIGRVKPLIKQTILKALVVCLAADDVVTVRGNDILRTVASCLDCPMPPLPMKL